MIFYSQVKGTISWGTKFRLFFRPINCAITPGTPAGTLDALYYKELDGIIFVMKEVRIYG